MISKTLIALAVGLALAAPLAQARVTKIEIDPARSQSPTFGGYSWPGVGQYEKVVGIAYGEVNPHDRQNKVIVDIEFAPRNARGNVEYAFNFYILKPIDLSKGARKMMYEPPNRGGKTWAALGRVTLDPGIPATPTTPAIPANGDDPGSWITNPTVLANSFLMPRGYTMMWSGWEDLGALDDPSFNATAKFPNASFAPTSVNPTGTITGPSYEYIVASGASSVLSYTAADTDTAKAKLTHRVHLNDAPEVFPAFGSSSCAAPASTCWAYTTAAATTTNPAGTAIRLVNRSTGLTSNFVANDIYEFAYTAKDPKVNGLGFAAVRDWLEWVRYERRDDFGNRNPLAGHIKRVYTEISSQPGRLLNDFRHLGFNETESGKKAFDGHVNWISAGNGINMNYRFSQSGRTERNRQNHLFIEGRFPFANVMTHDPITRETDSRYRRCEKTNTCPLGMEIYSANEYWVKAASLLHTTPDGTRDLQDSPFTRNYFMSSMRHGTAASPGGPGTLPGRGLCQQADNPLNSAPVQRALFIALDEWATKGEEPPHSRVPKLKDRTLVPPLPQSGMGFPNIPSPFADTPGPLVTYTGLKTTRYHFNYGLNFYDTGIATINPPVFPFTTPSYQDNPGNGPIYPSFIPKTDKDGNDIAGVRLADVTVPLATYTGWALRRGAHANDGCEAAGQFIPFPATAAARMATDDPRKAVAERYPTFEGYQAKVVKALNDMVEDRLLLCEDVPAELTRLIAAGTARGVPAATGPLPVASFPACEPHKGGHHHHHHHHHDDDDD